jgi:hypothetical protein
VSKRKAFHAHVVTTCHWTGASFWPDVIGLVFDKIKNKIGNRCA